MKALFDLAISHHILINPGEIYSEEANRAIRFSYSYIDVSDIDNALKQLSQLIIQLQ